VNFPDFNSRLALQLTAQNASATIRETQVFGIAVRGADQGGGMVLHPHYGINLLPSAISDRFFIFADLDADTFPGYTAGDQIVSTFKLEGIHTISDTCVSDDGIPANEQCISDGLSIVNILFQRPEPEPVINSIVNGNPVDDVQYVKIEISGEAQYTPINIFVWNNGQISIN
ncbi:hypothetical protein CL634_03680, partial [bacterium]|nr:hypothetical protein [bacterium]